MIKHIKTPSALPKILSVLSVTLLTATNVNMAIAAPNANSVAEITVEFSANCTSIDVESSKDLSNVVLLFEADPTGLQNWEKFYELTGSMDTFEGTEENVGRVIVRAFVKSGSEKTTYDGIPGQVGAMFVCPLFQDPV